VVVCDVSREEKRGAVLFCGCAAAAAGSLDVYKVKKAVNAVTLIISAVDSIKVIANSEEFN
jgi:hypothetical protein